MSVARLVLVVPSALAVLAAGVLPAEHVHHRADAAATVVHAHFESSHQGDKPGRPGDPHERSVADNDHDTDGTTVGLGQTVGQSPTVRSDYAPSLLPETVPLIGPSARHAGVSAACLERAQPPPLRQSIPRAPPV